MLKLTNTEKKALQELDKSKHFKAWRKEIIGWIVLLILAFVFFLEALSDSLNAGYNNIKHYRFAL